MTECPTLPVTVLLVEDNPADQAMARRTLTHKDFQVDLQIAADGEEALDYLLRRNNSADPATSPRPDVIFLDLNLPRIGGREVLSTIRQNAELKRIPVVVLSTSQSEREVAECYELGCSSFIHKPLHFSEFRSTVGRAGEYWFKTVTLPPRTV